MGYISPVTQYEYLQYATRTVEAEKVAKNTVFRFKPVQPVKFHQRDEQQDSLNESVDMDNFQFQSNHRYKNFIPTEIVKKTVTDVTGIGQFINESI